MAHGLRIHPHYSTTACRGSSAAQRLCCVLFAAASNKTSCITACRWSSASRSCGLTMATTSHASMQGRALSSLGSHALASVPRWACWMTVSKAPCGARRCCIGVEKLPSIVACHCVLLHVAVSVVPDVPLDKWSRAPHGAHLSPRLRGYVGFLLYWCLKRALFLYIMPTLRSTNTCCS